MLQLNNTILGPHYQVTCLVYLCLVYSYVHIILYIIQNIIQSYNVQSITFHTSIVTLRRITQRHDNDVSPLDHPTSYTSTRRDGDKITHLMTGPGHII